MSRPKRIRADAAPPGPGEVVTPRRLAARVPWTHVVLSLAVILSSAVAVRPVRDAATLAEVAEAQLERPLGYVALAPLSNVLDTLPLLSVRQHVALFIGMWLCFAAWRAWRHARRGGTWRGHLMAGGVLFAAFLLAYLAAVLVPRPMAYLTTRDPGIMRVDFHSHTGASRDARRAFSVERNRAWHRSGGYDVAFITDHATVSGAERGVAGNRVSGLDGPMLLQSIEVTWSGEHVSIPGAQRTYTGLLTENLRDVDSAAVALASVVATREPVIIWHHPRDLERLPVALGPGTGGVRAMEISNGAPDGMDEIRPKRAMIVALAQQANLALTSGSDNHGWGYVAPNWTLMGPSNWRGFTSDQLAQGIERVLREGGFQATRVVERTVAHATNPVGLALTVVAVPARMFTTLSMDERVMWLVWI